MGFDTQAIHAGEEPDFTGHPSGDVVVPIHLASTFARKDVDEPTGGFEYSRSGNPTRFALEKKLAAFPDPAPQVTDFVDAVKNRKKFALNEENGHRSCTLINLGKIALQLGRSLKFDPVTQTFPDDAGANELIHRQMRAPWII